MVPLARNRGDDRGPKGDDDEPGDVESHRLQLAVVALVAAACGDDDDDDAGAPAETAEVGPGADRLSRSLIGALTSLTGAFTPWGVQVRDGMQLAVDEINADGGVDGRPLELVVADDQTDPDAGRDRDRAPRRGGRGGDRRRHLERRRPGDGPHRRGAGDAAVPRQGRVRGDPHPGQPLHLPHVPARGADGGRPDRPVRRGRRGSPGSARSSPTTPGARPSAPRSRPSSASSRASSSRSRWHRSPRPTSRPTSATSSRSTPSCSSPPGTRRDRARSRCSRPDLGLDVPVTGAYSPLAARRVRRRRRGDRPLHRLRLRRLPERGVPGARPPLPGVVRQHVHGGRRRRRLRDRARWSPRAVAEAGDDPAAIAEYLHGQTFDLPGYAFEMGWTEWGELATAQPLFSVIGEGPGPGGRQRGRRLVPGDADPARAAGALRARVRSQPASAVPILELDGVEKRFGGLPAVDGRVVAGRRRRDRRPRRPQRRRQDHAAPHW